eukprot:NODE_936_length_1364_cov_63.596958_g780_i0.p1 GENE.NODE_936_length_1364_cov_63.596958_g780_i0~~NODE_936_length_1364_cov_63.596958_g780_i0.p1  ORF type:complete len:316 (+),score=92.47 NODE_936_length_1364_cov_63.596958_g780_i0:104-949(+)
MQQFRSVIEDVFSRAVRRIPSNHPEVWTKIQDMVLLWHNKEIFGPVLGARLRNCLTHARKLSHIQEVFPRANENILNEALSTHSGDINAAAEQVFAQQELLVIPDTIGSWADEMDNVPLENLDYPLDPLPLVKPPIKLHKTPVLRKDDNLRRPQPASLAERISSLEEIAARQAEELQSMARNTAKIDDFIRELKGECLKLVQRQHSCGHYSGNMVSHPEIVTRPKRRGRLSLNPQASPWIPAVSPHSSNNNTCSDATETGSNGCSDVMTEASLDEDESMTL